MLNVGVVETLVRTVLPYVKRIRKRLPFLFAYFTIVEQVMQHYVFKIEIFLCEVYIISYNGTLVTIAITALTLKAKSTFYP